MKYYVEAYDVEGRQMLGTMDGQTVLDCKRPLWTAHVRRLMREPASRLSLGGRARFYRIVTEAGRLVATIDKGGLKPAWKRSREDAQP